MHQKTTPRHQATAMAMVAASLPALLILLTLSACNSEPDPHQPSSYYEVPADFEQYCSQKPYPIAHNHERAFICTLHQRLRVIEAEQTAASHP